MGVPVCVCVPLVELVEVEWGVLVGGDVAVFEGVTPAARLPLGVAVIEGVDCGVPLLVPVYEGVLVAFAVPEGVPLGVG